MIFNGRKFAAERLAQLREERAAFGALRLGIVVAASDPVTASYVRIKEKNARALDVELVRFPISERASQEEAEAAVREANGCDGVIVQLPLTPELDVERIIAAMDIEKDVDVISPKAAALFASGKHRIMPPVASAINEIIDAYTIQVEGKRAVVVGKGRLVGAPAFHLLTMRGAEVQALDQSDVVSAHTRDADIIVLGAGVPSLLEADMVKRGVVVFDAGTSDAGRLPAGRQGAIAGDADPAVAEKASFFTPVPGGIGPVAVVEIFANLLQLKASA